MDKKDTVNAADPDRPATSALQGGLMPRRKQPSELRLCPAVGFSQIVGGKYKLRILWILIQRPYRYGEIRNSLIKGALGKPVTPRVLSRELKELQHRGLISRKQYDVVPPKVEYSLTELGRGIQPVLESIVDWGLTGAHEEILGINVNPPTFPVKAHRAST
jgi:DNA-binding HxlR family transcriptional regulator